RPDDRTTGRLDDWRSGARYTSYSIMSTSILESPAAPGLFTRLRSRLDQSMFYVGQITDLAVQTIQQLLRGPVERSLLIAQFDQVGVRSISIVVITSAFSGMVVAL